MSWLNDPHPTPTGNDPGLDHDLFVMASLLLAGIFLPLGALILCIEGQEGWWVLLIVWIGVALTQLPSAISSWLLQRMQRRTGNPWYPFKDREECVKKTQENALRVFGFGDPVYRRDVYGRVVLRTKDGKEEYLDDGSLR